MKTVLCLSGGGSKGAFQVGAITKLAEKGITFDAVAGVSVGALNGSMVAQDKLDDMRKIWETITGKQVFNKYGIPRIFLRNLLGKKSLYDLSPLMEILKEHLSIADLKKPFYCGVTSLVDGNYYSLGNNDFRSSLQFQQAVYASSAMPIFWEPTDITIGNHSIEGAVDGGLRNVTPLSDILQEDPTHIYIITCSKGDIKPYHSRNIVEIAGRTFLDIFLSEIIHNDIKDLLRINALVKQAAEKGVTLYKEDGTPFKEFEVTLIQPPYTLGDSIDFSRDKLDTYFQLGYEAA